MIDVHELTKRFGDHLAIDRISFQVAAGEVVGLLGPNGAGKTTTMRILTCFLPATSGRATVGGHDVFTAGDAVRRLVGYMPENTPLYGELRAVEYLHYRARLKGVPRRDRARVIGELAERCHLEPRRLRQRIETLSKGYRQRVGLADVLLGDPPVLILDEPTAGLDPRQVIQVRRLIKELGRDHTVILSTHILPEVEAVCDRVIIMDSGRIVPQEMIDSMLGRRCLRLEVRGEPTVAQALVGGIRGVGKTSLLVSEDGRCRLELEIEPEEDEVALREAIYRVCVAAQLPILELTHAGVSLEEVFVKVTSDRWVFRGEVDRP